MSTSPEAHGDPADSVRLAANRAGSPCPRATSAGNPLDQLKAALHPAEYDTRIDYVDGLRALHVVSKTTRLPVDVVALDGHFAVAFEPGEDLEAIAPETAIGLAVRRVTAMLAPAVTS